MYFLVLWLLGYLMLEKAWSIGKPRIASIGMLAMLVTPIIGYFLVNRFGLTGYIITVLGTGLAMKLYQMYV